MRIALGLEYDGSAFHGWQVQKNGASVQASLAAAASVVANHDVAIVGAGRTDARVHASGQVAHFDSAVHRTERSWILGINSNLPATVNVLWAKPVSDEFHARFSATSRSYRYVIFNRAVRTALGREHCYQVREPLDAMRMQEAAVHLCGEHDFSAFRSAHCQAHTARRHIHKLTVTRHNQHLLIEVTANAFLHNMVRIIVGVLLRIGIGEAATDWPLALLAGRDRRLSGVTAPPQGLYLCDVGYPGHFALPRHSSMPLEAGYGLS